MSKKLIPFLTIVGLILSLLVVAYTLGAFKDFSERIQEVVTLVAGGGATISIWAIVLWQGAPDFVKRLIARLIRLAPDVPNHFKRRAIKNEIESSINKAFKQFNREGAGFVDHEISISWLKPGDDAREIFFSSGKAYIKLDYSRSPEVNLVEAALLFCKRGLIPGTRQYIPRQLMKAIDLQFVDEILQRERAAGSRSYFVHEVIPRETEGSQGTTKFVDKLQTVSQYGLFTRVLLPELRDYPALAQDAWPYRRHAQEIESYLDFLEAAVKSREEGTKVALLHVGQAIRTAIVLVGIPSKLQFEGTSPYIRRTAMNEKEGAQTVYLLGYNEGVGYIELIAKESQYRGLVDRYNIELYDATVRNKVERHRLARLMLRTGEGSRFIAEYPSTSEWPDIQEDVEWRAILEGLTADRVKLDTLDQSVEEKQS